MTMIDESGPEIGVGSVLADTYEVTRLLGRGGMGAVWEASHKRLPGRKVAIKVLLGQMAANPEIYARFRHEAEVTSRLGHPNIVEAIDFNTLPSGTPYIVLEYLKGESLASRLKKGPVTLEATLNIVEQIGSALIAAHSAGVVHRDLKPDNVFLCPAQMRRDLGDHVKVLDFGISKIRDSQTVQTKEFAMLGTPQYMAPEQAFGKNKEIDGRTDQFALGTIVYEMLSGTAAFAGETLIEVIVKVTQTQPPLIGTLVPGLPVNVVTAVDRALSKKMDARWPDMNSFVTALSGIGSVPIGGDMAGAQTIMGPATPIPITPSNFSPVLPSSISDTTVTPPANSTNKRYIIGGLAGAAIVGAGLFAAFHSSPPVVTPAVAVVQPVAKPLVAVAPPVDKPPVAVAPSVDKPSIAVVRPVDEPPVAVALDHPTKKPQPARPGRRNGTAQGGGNGIPADAFAELANAEAAMRGADQGASVALSADGTAAVNCCSRGDVAGARSYLIHVSAAERKRVRARCKQAGYSLP